MTREPPPRALTSTHGLAPRRQVLLALAAALAHCAHSSLASADSIPLIGRPKGRPRIQIARVRLPDGVANSAEYLRHLKFALTRAARHADWGTGRNTTIALRFEVEKLQLEPSGRALRVHCSALGELPRRRTARSQLVYGGELGDEKKLVKQVLEIVARGVVSRLADLERERRGR